MNKAAIIFGISCLAISIIASLFFYIKGKIELKKEKDKNQKQEKKNEKIDNETIENISTIASGDIHAGNNILHNLAEKRKR